MEAARGGPSSASSGGGGVYGSLKDWLLNWRRPQYPTPSAYTSSGSKSGSGTTLSNTYTSGSGASHLSSYDHRLLNALVLEERAEELAKERAEELWGATKGQRPEKSFCGGDVSALESWLMVLDVGWVLCIADDASAAAAAGGLWHLSSAIVQRDYTGRWIQALTVIMRTILRAYSDPFGCGLSDLYIVLEEEEPATAMEQEQEQDPDQLQLTRARFAEAAILRMLPFVDAIAASSASAGCDIILAGANGAPVPTQTERLEALLNVRDALSNASSGIQLWLHSASSAEAKQESDEVLALLAAKEKRLDEAIWNIMEGIRARILSPLDEKALWGAQSPEGSPDIVRVTRSLTNHIRFLWGNEKPMRHIVRAAADHGDYVPDYDRISCFLSLSEQDMSTDEPFVSLTLEMVSCLEDKLANRSESFRSHGLRVLFLINNTRFIWQQLHPLLLGMEYHMSLLAQRIEDYIQRYLQVSWAPVVSSLYYIPPPLCFGRNNYNNSCLPRFELEFQKTYFAQKLWKVPDPELRRRLRQAVTERVVSGFREYLEHDNNSTPSPRVTLTPLELEHMLQELFEG